MLNHQTVKLVIQGGDVIMGGGSSHYLFIEIFKCVIKYVVKSVELPQYLYIYINLSTQVLCFISLFSYCLHRGRRNGCSW